MVFSLHAVVINLMLMDIRCICFTVLIPLSIAGQSQSQDQRLIDSLMASLPGSHGNDRIHTLYELSSTLLNIDNQLALRYALEGLNLATAAEDSLQVVRTGRVIGSALWRLQKLDSSIQVFTLMHKIADQKGYQQDLGWIAGGLGIVHTFTAQYDKALQFYFQSLEIQRQTKDTVGEIRTLVNIGVVYYKLKDYEKSLHYFTQSKDIQERTGFQIDRDVLLNNMGLAYAYLKKFDDALRHIDLGLEMCGADCPDRRRMEAFFAKGVVHMGLGELFRSENYFLQSYLLSKQLGNVRFQLDNIDYLSQIYRKWNRLREAASYLHLGEALVVDYPAFMLENVKLYLQLSDLYRSLRKFERASDYQLKYAQLRDSLFSEELTNNLMRIEAENLERDNLRKIESQKQILALNEHIIDRQKTINRLSLLVILIAAGLVIVLYRTYQQKKRINAFLDGKIGERTRELYMSNEQLSKAFYERDLMLHHADTTYKTLATRIEGLYLNALKEVSDPVARTYILKIGALVKNEEKSS